MCRLAQSVKNAFQGKAHQYLVEIHALCFGEVEQPRADGCSEVIVHSIASR